MPLSSLLLTAAVTIMTAVAAEEAAAKPEKVNFDKRLADKGLHQYDKANPSAYKQLKQNVPLTEIGTESAAQHQFDNIVVMGDFHGDLFQCLTNLRGMQVVSYQQDYYANQYKMNKAAAAASGKNEDQVVEDETLLQAEEKMNSLFIFNKRGNLMEGATADGYHWKNENMLVVVVGDTMNGGPDDIEIVRLFMRLDGEAQRKNSRFIYMFGNHEVNNLMSNFVGVHPQSFIKSGGRSGRVQLLSMDNPVGRYLRTRPALFEYDGLIFLHGGIFPSTLKAVHDRLKDKKKTFKKHGSIANADEALPSDFAEEVNTAVRNVLTGKTPLKEGDLAFLVLDYRYDKNGADGPELIHPLYECENVHEVVQALGLQAQVVGHTPHALPRFEFCHGELFAVDFLMSRWKGGVGSGVGALLLTRSHDKSNVTATIQHLDGSAKKQVQQGDHPTDKKGNAIHAKTNESEQKTTSQLRKEFHTRHDWHWNAHLIVPDEAEVAADENRDNAGDDGEAIGKQGGGNSFLSMKHPIVYLVAVCLGVILVEIVRTWCVDR